LLVPVAAGTLLLLSVACSPSDPQNTLAATGIVAKKQQDLFWTVMAWATGVFILVEALLVFTLWRFKGRGGAGEPHQTHGNTRLEIAWTIAPVLVLLTVAVPTVSLLWELAEPPKVSTEVKVVGHQWWWEFEYPGYGITTANELHLPQGEVINFHVTSVDVIHSFWIPKLGGKLDAIPGKVQSLWLRGDEPGTYYAQCVELCGVQHANMKFRVVVHTRDKFEQWVKDQRTPARTPDAGTPEAAGLLVFTSNCVACHTIDGVPGAVGKAGPNLSRFGSRQTLGAGMVDNTLPMLEKWIADTTSIKPGINSTDSAGQPTQSGALTPMPRFKDTLSGDQIKSVAAFLYGLK